MQTINKEKNTNWKIAGVLCMFLLLGIVVSFLIPITAPVISAAFIIGGIKLYRQTKEGIIHAIALALIISGIVIIFLVLLILLFLMPANLEIKIFYEISKM